MQYLLRTLTSLRLLSTFQFRKSTFLRSFCSWYFSLRTMFMFIILRIRPSIRPYIRPSTQLQGLLCAHETQQISRDLAESAWPLALHVLFDLTARDSGHFCDFTAQFKMVSNLPGSCKSAWNVHESSKHPPKVEFLRSDAFWVKQLFFKFCLQVSISQKILIYFIFIIPGERTKTAPHILQKVQLP